MPIEPREIYMTTVPLAVKLTTLRRWYSEHAARRGGRPPPPLGDRETIAAVAAGYSMLHIPLADGVPPGTVRDGVRTLARAVTAVFVLDTLDTDTALRHLASVEAQHKGSDIDIIGDSVMLNQTVPKKMAEHGARHKITVRYFHFCRFCTDITRHAHVQAAQHYLPDLDELNKYLRFTFTQASSLSRLSVFDPQCVWLGARPGDVVAVREVTQHTHAINYYFVVAARLGLRGLR